MQRLIRWLTRGLIVGMIALPASMLPSASPPPAAQAQAAAPAWRDTGVQLATAPTAWCFDPTQAHVLLVSEPGAGSVAYDWATGARTVINPQQFAACGPQGLLFAWEGDRAWRFSRTD